MPTTFKQLITSLGGEKQASEFVIDTFVRLTMRAAQVQDEDFDDPQLFQSAEMIYSCLCQLRSDLDKGKS